MADRIFDADPPPVRITDPKSPSDLNIVMDPQPFPRRFLGNQVDDENHLQSRDTDRNVVAALYEIFPNTKFTSRDSAAIDIS